MPKEQRIVVENTSASQVVIDVESEEMKANIELAKVSAEPGFLGLVQQQISWRGVCGSLVKVENAEGAKALTDHFDGMKKDLKALETLRLSKVAFPTKVVRMINGLFKQVKDGIESDKGKVGGLIADWNVRETERVERLRREVEEQKEKGEVQVTKEEAGEDGVGKVQFGTPVPDLPGNVVESARGAKVQMRSGLEVEVTDLGEFLKLLVSKSEGNKWISDAKAELITVNVNVMAKLLKANPKRRNVKGLRIKKVSKAV